MKQCVVDTLADLDAQISRLQDLRAGLSGLFSGGDRQVEPVAIASRPVRRGACKGKRGRRPYPAMRGDAARIVEVARKLKEPVTCTGLCRAANIPKSSAGSSITRWVKRGWLTKVDFGEYNRTTTFGQVEGATEGNGGAAKAAPSLNRVALQARLEDALKQRDHARENGREEIAKIFQRDVEKLEAQLATV